MPLQKQTNPPCKSIWTTINQSMNQVVHIPSTARPNSMSITIEHKKCKPMLSLARILSIESWFGRCIGCIMVRMSYEAFKVEHLGLLNLECCNNLSSLQ